MNRVAYKKGKITRVNVCSKLEKWDYDTNAYVTGHLNLLFLISNFENIRNSRLEVSYRKKRS